MEFGVENNFPKRDKYICISRYKLLYIYIYRFQKFVIRNNKNNVYKTQICTLFCKNNILLKKHTNVCF